MELLDSIWIVVGYILIAKTIFHLPVSRWRDGLFALTNLTAVALVYDWGAYILFLVGYVAFVLFQYLVCFKWKYTASAHIVGILFPVIVLFLLKYLPDGVYNYLGFARPNGSGPIFIGIVGLSYMAFRLSYIVTEVRAKVVPVPGIAQYLSFAFFLPTLAVGPISKFQTFYDSYNKSTNNLPGFEESMTRVAIGLAKFALLAPLFSQFQFDSLLMDRHVHEYWELAVACVGFYLFLYCNFSGFCDMAIGLAGLIGVRVDENFNNPFVARNLQDFWNRWHITLNVYMRDMLFTPMSKALVHRFGPKHLNVAIVLSLFVVFLLIGVWHGREVQFLLFGLMHAIGVTVVHIYGLVLRKSLGAQGYRLYQSNSVVRCVAILLTFCFVASTFLVFANDMQEIETLWQTLG